MGTAILERSQTYGSTFHAGVGAKLTHSAAQQGGNPDELAQEILARYFEEETRFVEL